MVDFLFAIIELSSLTLTVADIGRSPRFSEAVGQFMRKFQVEGYIGPLNGISPAKRGRLSLALSAFERAI